MAPPAQASCWHIRFGCCPNMCTFKLQCPTFVDTLLPASSDTLNRAGQAMRPLAQITCTKTAVLDLRDPSAASEALWETVQCKAGRDGRSLRRPPPSEGTDRQCHGCTAHHTPRPSSAILPPPPFLISHLRIVNDNGYLYLTGKKKEKKERW